MDLERLVRQARQGDVSAFVALTRGFQHVAFGSALAVLRDFHQAEDVAQEAFVAAWSALPSLADPAAFPGWLRGIVRHHAFRVVRRLGRGRDPVSFFTLVPQWEGFRAPGYSFAEGLKKDGYGEGTQGPVQTFFFWGEEGAWTAERLASLAPVDTLIHLSRARIDEKIYPGVDVLTSRSRVLETDAVSREHRTIAARAREAIARLREGGDGVALERARKLQNYFGQPFYVAEEYTKRSGTTVTLREALEACRDILDGRYDDWPSEAFYFAGGLDEIRARAGR